jgi:glycosyltransferase involved in cell wall biosynthesis
VKRSKAIPRQISSFDIYLGSIDSPPTAAQLALLTRSDLTILDLLRPDVDAALQEIHEQCFLGRIDLATLVPQHESADDVLEELGLVIATTSRKPQWSGIVLAGWGDRLDALYMQKLLLVLGKSGLLVYLEAAAPDFLLDDTILSNETVDGLVFRNATILPDGQHRDYFDMEHLRPALRAAVRECCYRNFEVLSWEEVESDTSISSAVLRRGMKWCAFYNIIPWVGTSAALMDVAANLPSHEPLSAFDWLKDDDVMGIQTCWRQNSSIMREKNELVLDAWATMSQLHPDTSSFLGSMAAPGLAPSEWSRESKSVSRMTRSPTPHSDILPSVDQDHFIKNMGCFPLGVQVTPLALAEVWQAQLRLKNLGLSETLDAQAITDMGKLLMKFHFRHLLVAYETDPQLVATVKDLFELARNGLLKVNLLLNPSFKHCSGARFWAICSEDTDGTEIYISKDAQDAVGTILHAFLSSKGFARDTCMEMENALAKWSQKLDKDSGLPPRLRQDVDSLTPEERILLLQQITSADHSNDVSASVGLYIRKSLIDQPTLVQLNELSSVDFLSGKISPIDLLRARFEWYDEQSAPHPSLEAAMAFFSGWQEKMASLLQNRREADLKTFLIILKSVCSVDRIDAWADVLALATLCFARKAAFDEIYLEVIDRNPLLNDQPDQAAVFAESFALGSRCEAYFGISPNVFGRLISDRFRSHYQRKQPPSWINGAPEFATVYNGAQLDVDRIRTTKEVPKFQRFTSLSVFAVPALVDIILLTTTGRGLYLTAFMTDGEQRSATIALLTALLVSGAAGTSIACGGSYYLMSMAFSAMNIFVLSRFIAGMAFAVFGAAVAFTVIAGVEGAYLAIIFALYFLGFMAYLTLFAAIASFQFPGSSFLSGRKYVYFCLPWLLVSPIVSMFTVHDIPIYLTMMYVVIFMLTASLLRVGSQWTSWYDDLKQIDDSEIRNWYTSTRNAGEKSVLNSMTDPGALRIARTALYEDVCAELDTSFFRKPTEDILVRGLVKDYEATSFLLDWYCRYSDVPRPIPYSSSWNIQTKVALNTLREAQKGIRVHSAFIHWRQTGDEIGCGVLYFLVALLDKWVEMLSGVHLTGLSASLNNQNRVAVGFGLAYYLIGAVLIDVKAQKLHEFVNVAETNGIRTEQDYRSSQKRSIRSRRAMYYKTLLTFLAYHCWSLTFAATLVWVFQDSAQTVFVFIAYVFAYTGLLWYQYTKIFSGPHALKPLLTAVCIGLPVGLVLKKTLPDFLYTGVITLALGTWTAALLCLWTSGIGIPKIHKSAAPKTETYHAYNKPWADPEWSQTELRTMYAGLRTLTPESRHLVVPTQYPGLEVRRLLKASTANDALAMALPNWEDWTSYAIDAWENGKLEIQLIPLSAIGSETRAISCRSDDRVILLIGVTNDKQYSSNIQEDPRIIAELLLHEISEVFFGVPPHHAHLAEQIITSPLPENVKLFLNEEADLLRVHAWANQAVLKSQCCGLDCDLIWDQLPQIIRKFFLQRCLGQSSVNVSGAEREALFELPQFSAIEDLDLQIARCDIAGQTTAHIVEHSMGGSKTVAHDHDSEIDEIPDPWSGRQFFITLLLGYVYHALGLTFKIVMITMLADAEAQRELDFMLRDQYSIVRVPVVFFINCLWVYAKFIQDVALSFFLFNGRPKVKKLWEDSRGGTVLHKRNRMVVQGQNTAQTVFKHKDPMGGYKSFHYDGVHKEEPLRHPHLLCAVANYTKDNELTSKEVYEHGAVSDRFEWVYNSPRPEARFMRRRKPRIPDRRRCIQGKSRGEILSYNDVGLVTTGAFIKEGEVTHFTFRYRKNGQYLDELLRAEYSMPAASCSVSWCVPPRRHPERLDTWIPHSKAMSVTLIHGLDEYQSNWVYDHRFHPTINTTLNGKVAPTPPMIEHDWFDVFEKPKIANFMEENPYFHSTRSLFNVISGIFGQSKQLFPVSIAQSRSQIWKAWKKNNNLDGAVIEWLDQKLLRRDACLAPYWRWRDWGNLRKATQYLNAHVDAVVASADLDDEISGWTPLAIKLDDLYNFGAAGDAILHTKSEDLGYDTSSTLHVLASDNGTWPNEGGGVSACRRDLVNSLNSVKWHMLCESANDFGVYKYQTERNVHSLKVVPLWGLDFLSPTHGLFKNRLHAEVNAVNANPTDFEIREGFVPCLEALVMGARTTKLSSADIARSTRALVNLNNFFQKGRNWSHVWASDPTKYAWRSLWLDQDMPNAQPASEWLDTELPTLGHLDTALELWFRYLFVFSIRVPDHIPAVYQVSHHSVSAAYGIVCKVKGNCQLHVWDHGVSWRETNMCLSATLCKLPPFVRNCLLGLMRLTSVLVLHHADIILPCADFFNPSWETEIGTWKGTLEHRNKFKRKIAPVVNGITDASKFKPVKEITTKLPTVTMLSHLWFAKDLKTAILAADIIINEWGFADYRLDIYGSIEKAPAYSNECQELIASKSLRNQVRLCGTADPLSVLEQTWVFMNSSLSEGLPLALGEAALTGVPVVCTDVGASLRVLTDPKTSARYSAVVAPNDPRALARAQIKLLALLDEWGAYAEDEGPSPSLPTSPTSAEVSSITARMYEKSPQRCALGLRNRAIVESSFGGARYLREHEQMLWIGKSHHHMAERMRTVTHVANNDFLRTPMLAQPEEVARVIPRSVAPSNWRSVSPAPGSIMQSVYSGLGGRQSPRAQSRISMTPTAGSAGSLLNTTRPKIPGRTSSVRVSNSSSSMARWQSSLGGRFSPMDSGSKRGSGMEMTRPRYALQKSELGSILTLGG